MEYKSIKRVNFSSEQCERFWSLVDRNQGVDGCWPWKGATSKAHGFIYGVWKWNTGLYKPHRVAYVLVKGNLSNRLTLDHLCNNKLCCNPNHLEAVTLIENVKRRDHSLIRTCMHGHVREPGRMCKECNKFRGRKWRAAHPGASARLTRESYQRRKAKMIQDLDLERLVPQKP